MHLTGVKFFPYTAWLLGKIGDASCLCILRNSAGCCYLLLQPLVCIQLLSCSKDSLR